jgi:hypothetical protein
MTTLREAAQQALEYMKSVGQMDMYPEEWAIVERLEAALAEPVGETTLDVSGATSFSATPAKWPERVAAIRSLTDQCAALIRERDDFQKQLWRYEKNGVTCQTYRHTVEQTCAECNVQMCFAALLTAEKDKEIERLRKALGKYGQHLNNCAVTLGGYQCTCGFNQQEQPQ